MKKSFQASNPNARVGSQDSSLRGITMGAFIVRIGFWSPVHYIYIWYPPPHVPTPVFSISALGRDGFLSCRTEWVNGRKSACKSYVSSSSSSAKLAPRTQIGRIQTYSKRILLNTPRIQDSRFKVPGRTLPCTLNLESWIRGVFNRIRFEYV